LWFFFSFFPRANAIARLILDPVTERENKHSYLVLFLLSPVQFSRGKFLFFFSPLRLLPSMPDLRIEGSRMANYTRVYMLYGLASKKKISHHMLPGQGLSWDYGAEEGG
jgi:hypothetical protein